MGRQLIAVVAFAVAVGAATGGESAGERWWAHVRTLADDSLQGRDTGSEGFGKATAYVVQQFRQRGLEPAGVEGYLQPVSLRSRRLLEEQSSLALVRDGTIEPLTLGEDAYFNMRVDPAAEVDAPLVFAGYGLVVPESQVDDLAGLDLRGKVVVHLMGAPPHVPGPLQAHYQEAGERWAFLRRAGAVGTIAIRNPSAMDAPWERATLARLEPSMSLADSALIETVGQQLSVTFNPEHAETLFAGSDLAFREVLALANAGKALPRFPLRKSVRATVRVESRTIECRNVVGLLAGTDPQLQHEFVVLIAHLDHVGIGAPVGGDAIYNGAMDNASGIATLIEVAGALHEKQARLRRSVLFVTVTAEERGLLGSKYFVSNPTVPRGAIVASLNVDMFLPLMPLRSVIAQGLEESDLGDVMRDAAKTLGIDALSDPEPERRAFTRSDHYSFVRRGIPALSLKVGFLKDSPEHARVRQWRTEHYHAPSDDVPQPVDLEAAAAFNRMMVALVEAVANRPERPQWKPGSFFRRFATTSGATQ